MTFERELESGLQRALGIIHLKQTLQYGKLTFKDVVANAWGGVVMKLQIRISRLVRWLKTFGTL